MDVLKTKIEIQQLRVPAFIGCTDSERCKAQEVAFDVFVYFNGDISLESDKLKDTIDYISLRKWIIDSCKENSVSLLEHLAWIVSQSIYKNAPTAEEIHLKIKKFTAMTDAEHTAFGLVTRRKS